MASVESLLKGAIETHVHSAPDLVPRCVDDAELAEHARAAGMRAIVLKSHHTLTADRAILVRKMVPGLEVFGGIALNYPVGGLNPQAVEAALRFGAKIVWMPTFTAANHVSHMQKRADASPLLRLLGTSPDAGITILDEGGRLRPAVGAILKLIADHDAILATGHISRSEIRALVPAAWQAGVRKILITHPELDVVDMPLEQQKELAAQGVYFERCFIVTTMGFDAPRLARSIREVGVESTVMATDFGQAVNPPPIEGLRSYIQAMLEEGFSPDEIELMLKANPAKLLGLA